MLLFRQKCDEESVGWVGGQTGGQTLLHIQLWYFSLTCVAKDSYSLIM